MIKLSLLFFLLFPRVSLGEFISIKLEVGIGHSDNVYQDDLNKKSDFFLWVQGKAKYQLSDADLAAKVNLSLYTRERSNNSISYSLFRKSELLPHRMDLVLGLGAFNYLNTDIASTDESYNRYYAAGNVSINVHNKKNLTINLEPGAKFILYPKNNNRFDTNIFFRVDSSWTQFRNNELNPYLEVGFLISSQGYYTKNYLEFGALWDRKISDNYKFDLDMYFRNSKYPNRKVSDILILPNRNGRQTSVSQEVNEVISLSQISASLMKTASIYDLTAGIVLINESSLSQLEYFQEIQSIVSCTWYF